MESCSLSLIGFFSLFVGYFYISSMIPSISKYAVLFFLWTSETCNGSSFSTINFFLIFDNFFSLSLWCKISKEKRSLWAFYSFSNAFHIRTGVLYFCASPFSFLQSRNIYLSINYFIVAGIASEIQLWTRHTESLSLWVSIGKVRQKLIK